MWEQDILDCNALYSLNHTTTNANSHTYTHTHRHMHSVCPKGSKTRKKMAIIRDIIEWTSKWLRTRKIINGEGVGATNKKQIKLLSSTYIHTYIIGHYKTSVRIAAFSQVEAWLRYCFWRKTHAEASMCCKLDAKSVIGFPTILSVADKLLHANGA